MLGCQVKSQIKGRTESRVFMHNKFLFRRNNPHFLRNSAHCTFIQRKFTYFELLRSIPQKLLRRRHIELDFRYLILYSAYSASIRNATQTRFVSHFRQQILRNALYQYTICAISQTNSELMGNMQNIIRKFAFGNPN